MLGHATARRGPESLLVVLYCFATITVSNTTNDFATALHLILKAYGAALPILSLIVATTSISRCQQCCNLTTYLATGCNCESLTFPSNSYE